MYIYIVVLTISLLFASMLMEVKKFNGPDIEHFGVKFKKKYAEYFLLFLSMSPFIILSGVRYDVGVDYFYTYTKIYDYVAQGLSHAQVDALWNCEPGFWLLNKIIITMGGGYVWLFTITSAIIIALFWIAFYQQSDNLCLSILLFFCAETYFISLAYVRQFIALAVIFYGLKYTGGDGIKNILKFIVCAAVAVTFHKSAIIMLPLVIAPYIKLHPSILTSAIIVISLFKDKFESLLITLLQYTPYANYIGSVYQSPSRFYLTRPVAYTAVFVLACFIYKKCKNDRRYHLMLNVTALLILITVNFDIMPQLDRVTWYFEAIIALFVPYVLKNVENAWLRKVITIGVITMFSIFTYHNVVVCFSHGVVPYRIVFAPDMVIY